MERCITSPHLFTPDRIEVIFANIKDLLNFQKRFLSKLETCVTPADLSQSQIGAIFTDHVSSNNFTANNCLMKCSVKILTVVQCTTYQKNLYNNFNIAMNINGVVSTSCLAYVCAFFNSEANFYSCMFEI